MGKENSQHTRKRVDPPPYFGAGSGKEYYLREFDKSDYARRADARYIEGVKNK